MASYRRVDDLTVTCRLTACTPGSAPGPTLGIEYGKPWPFYLGRKTFTQSINLYKACCWRRRVSYQLSAGLRHWSILAWFHRGRPACRTSESLVMVTQALQSQHHVCGTVYLKVTVSGILTQDRQNSTGCSTCSYCLRLRYTAFSFTFNWVASHSVPKPNYSSAQHAWRFGLLIVKALVASTKLQYVGPSYY